MVWKIDAGMFKGNFGQLFNKFSWGLTTNTIGNLVSHVYNLTGNVKDVTYGQGATVVDTISNDTNPFTIGYYINGEEGFKADWKDHTFVHEYGHSIQSSIYGPLYLPLVAWPSSLSAAGLGGPNHQNRWFEVQASKFGGKYFDKKYGSGADGYSQTSAEYFDYEAFNSGTPTLYRNPRTLLFQQSDHPVSGGQFKIWDVIVPIFSLSLGGLLFY